MDILTKLTIKNLKLNKKRTIGTIIGIILSVSLICAISGVFTSFHQTILENAINETGYYHLKLIDITNDDLKNLQANRDIKNIKTTHYLGTSKIDVDNKEYPYIDVYSSDYIKDLSYQIIEGRRPNNNNEIIINKKLTLDSNYKIGDQITLNIGTRKTNDGYELNENNPYNEDNYETIENTKKYTYKIVGIFTKPGYNYSYYGITTKENTTKINAYISLKNPKNYKETNLEILGLEDNNNTKAKYTYEINSELLRWEIFAFSDSTITMLYMIAGVVIFIVLITSVFCIKNSFEISTTEKTKMYGMLTSIGGTKKQIKKCVLKEGIILGTIGIPLGIISGIFAVYIITKVINIILKGQLFENINHVVFHISIIGIIISCILGLITIYLSAIKSAIKASKISPIENLKSTKEIKIKKEKLKTPKYITKYFKIGGSLAYKNLKRSKKKYRTTVISLIVSIFIFITMNSFLTEAFSITNKYYEDYDYNLTLKNIENLTDEEINKIENFKDVKKSYVIYSINDKSNGYIKITDQSKLVSNNQIFELNEDCIINEKEERICDEEKYAALEIKILDDKTFKEYMKKLKIDYEENKTKGILIDDYKTTINGKEKQFRRYKYTKNETIKGSLNGNDINITIGKITTTRPFGLENNFYSDGYLIINKDYYKNLNIVAEKISIQGENVMELVKDIESISSEIFVTNYDEEIKYQQSIKLVVSIFLYGFITIITLIGITNIFNTITSNMELRSKEIAMLKSIGMTTKEFNHMINLETLFYSTKSLIYGIILGLLGSSLIHKIFSQKNNIPYKIPTIPIIISIIFVILLVYIIMKYSISKINKQNTIETVRKENI